MAQSIRDQILTAAVAALNAPPDKPATTYRTRTAALAAGELGTALLLAPTEEDPNRVGPNTMQRVLVFRVEIVTAGAPPQDQALDPLLTFVVNTLWAADAFLALLKHFTEGKIIWEFASAEQQTTALAAQEFQVTYFTSLDPSGAARV